MSSHPVVSDTLRGRRSQHDVKPCVNLSEYKSHLGSTAQTHSITLTEDISSESLTVSFRSDIYIRIPHRKAITIPSPWMSNAKITNEPGCFSEHSVHLSCIQGAVQRYGRASASFQVCNKIWLGCTTPMYHRLHSENTLREQSTAILFKPASLWRFRWKTLTCCFWHLLFCLQIVDVFRDERIKENKNYTRYKMFWGHWTWQTSIRIILSPAKFTTNLLLLPLNWHPASKRPLWKPSKGHPPPIHTPHDTTCQGTTMRHIQMAQTAVKIAGGLKRSLAI